MDLVKEILKEHSRSQAEKIVKYVGEDPDRLKSLVEVFHAGPYRITQRAAWPLSLCLERHPELAKPHIRSIVNTLEKPGLHNGVKRNVLRLLQHVELPVNLHGKISNLCFQYLADNGEAIAIRVFAMTVLERIIANNPEMSRELRVLIEDHLPFASPGYLSRARKILKKLPNNI